MRHPKRGYGPGQGPARGPGNGNPKALPLDTRSEKQAARARLRAAKWVLVRHRGRFTGMMILRDHEP
ncbi:MAG TPA: hypothetical protein PLC74_07855 [Acetobacteraceae bacterium]|nr:hypothetical protein [Acetobacteraceae bacterium]